MSAEPSAVPAISTEDFNVEVLSENSIAISYSLLGFDHHYVLDMNVDYSPGELETFDCPATKSTAEIVEVLGLSTEEFDAFDKWMLANDIEPDLINVFEGDKS